MKKITLISLLLLSVFTISAQSDKGDFELGANIGVNFSNSAINGTAEPGQTDSKISFNLAASGEYYFSDRWGIKAKLVLDNKGWANDFVELETEETIEGDYILNYISIPVMANWHFGKKRNWYLNFGLYTAFLTKAEIEDIDISPAFEESDFGLAFGIGVKFPISDRAKFFVEYDAQSGFSNIVKNSGSVTVSNGRSAFNVGVLFDL